MTDDVQTLDKRLGIRVSSADLALLDRVMKRARLYADRVRVLGDHVEVTQRMVIIEGLKALERFFDERDAQMTVSAPAAVSRASQTVSHVIAGKEAARLAVRHGVHSQSTAEKWFRSASPGAAALGSLQDVLVYVRSHAANLWHECDDADCLCHSLV